MWRGFVWVALGGNGWHWHRGMRVTTFDLFFLLWVVFMVPEKRRLIGLWGIPIIED
jgi:hypothetical protein